mgnify:CR=1 FL=1
MKFNGEQKVLKIWIEMQKTRTCSQDFVFYPYIKAKPLNFIRFLFELNMSVELHTFLF